MNYIAVPSSMAASPSFLLPIKTCTVYMFHRAYHRLSILLCILVALFPLDYFLSILRMLFYIPFCACIQPCMCFSTTVVECQLCVRSSHIVTFGPHESEHIQSKSGDPDTLLQKLFNGQFQCEQTGVSLAPSKLDYESTQVDVIVSKAQPLTKNAVCQTTQFAS